MDRALASGTDDLYATALEQAERYLFTRVLQETGGNQSQAAEILGIGRGKVAARIQAFGIRLEHAVRMSEESQEC